jgi:hypothetical protein
LKSSLAQEQNRSNESEISQSYHMVKLQFDIVGVSALIFMTLSGRYHASTLMDSAMRDGIPRTLPCGRKWQITVEFAARPADRGTKRVTEVVKTALRDDLARVFSAQERDVLRSFAKKTEQMLPGFEAAALATLQSMAPAGPFRDVLRGAQEMMANGADMRSALQDSVSAVCHSQLAARLRQLNETLAPKVSPSELKVVMNELVRASSAIDCRAEASSFLGLHDAGSRNAITKLSPDDDLRAN